MTISPGDPGPTDLEDGDAAIPPYEGRRESADIDEDAGTHRDGANVGGATGPVESDEMKSPDSDETERGAVASPADEQPAERSGGAEPGAADTGPAHHPGTTRGEDYGDESGDG